MCSGKEKKLCDDHTCMTCYDRSLLSCKAKTAKGKPKIECWDNDNIKPRVIPKGSSRQCYFKCDECGHSFTTVAYSFSSGTWCPYCASKILCCDDQCSFCYEKSFLSYTGKTPKDKLKIECIDTGLNPRNIFIRSSTKKYNFTCDVCEHSFSNTIDNIFKGVWCPYCNSNKKCKDNTCLFCFQKSFADSEYKTKHGTLFSDLWDHNKNKTSLDRVSKNSNKKYFFLCKICTHSFKLILNNLSNCPYCRGKICSNLDCTTCFDKKFISCDKKYLKCWDFEKNAEHNLDRLVKKDKRKFYFKCDTCNHSFIKALCEISSKNSFCPYCSPRPIICNDESCNFCFKKSFASYRGKTFSGNYVVDCWDYNRNTRRPRDFLKGHNGKHHFICDNCGTKFFMKIGNIVYGKTWCPVCPNKSEKKFSMVFRDLFPLLELETQKSFDWCKTSNKKFMYFDFCIKKYKIMIEIDGRQHFKQVSNWGSPVETLERDVEKMKKAIENGYSVIRIIQEDIWHDRNDWKEKLKESIETLKSDKRQFLILIGDEKKYQKHLQLLID